jgi:hypothetical protein
MRFRRTYLAVKKMMYKIFFLITLVLVYTANVFSQEKKVKVLLLGAIGRKKSTDCKTDKKNHY